MTDVEKIALWFGLVSSIVSIVLSIVAILFARIVDKSARDVSDQTIKSLQKIESDVARLSSDTTGLIKAGWDRMLGSVGTFPVGDANISAKEIASGLLAELRANTEEQVGQNEDTDLQHGQNLTDLFKYLERSLEAQIRTQSRSERPSEALDHVVSLLNSLPLEARALARLIADRGSHLSFNQFQSLLKDSWLSEAVSELRDKGLLIPLSGVDPSKGKPIPVYYFPPTLSHALRAALLLLPDTPEDVETRILAELKRIGYV
jgi:hypothetical protein